MLSSKRFIFPGMTSSKPTATASKTPLIIRFYDADVRARDAHGRTQEEILDWPDNELESCHNYIQMLFPVPEGSAFNWEAPIIDREVMDSFRARADLRSRLRQSFERMLGFYGFMVTFRPEKEDNFKAEDETDQRVKSETKDRAGAKMKEPAIDTAEKSETPASGSLETKPTFEETSATKTEDTKQDKGPDASKKPAEPELSFPSGASSNSASFVYHIVRAPHWHKSFRNWAVRFDHNHLRITRILRCLRVLGLQSECDSFFAALKGVFEDPAIKISERSMMYWTRAVTRSLYIAPDDDRIDWLKDWENEQEAKKANVKVEDKDEVEAKEGKDEEE